MTEHELKTIALQLAIQLSAQLPSDRDDAQKVITYLQSLVDNWLFSEDLRGGGG
jgi:hypothetical protein